VFSAAGLLSGEDPARRAVIEIEVDESTKAHGRDWGGEAGLLAFDAS